MPRITVELVEQADQQLNAAKHRELTLRGNHIEVLENLGITNDQYDCIDFSDNNIIKISEFPPLKKLKVLLFGNNHIQRIADDAFTNLPHVESIVLTKNKIRSLGDLLPLAKCTNLDRLSLRENDICLKEYYRYYVIWILRDTKLRFLDFQRVTESERQAAASLFSGEKGEKLMLEIAPPRQKETAASKKASAQKTLTDEQKNMITILIQNATTDAEIDEYTEYHNGKEVPAGLLEKRIAALDNNEMELE